MDIHLQELIDKIKRDGVESASEEAAALTSRAQTEARGIVEAAKKEAEAILSRAKTDAEKFEKAAVAALDQASRNLVLAFRAEIEALLNKIVSRETAAAFGEDVLKASLPEILKAWAGKGAGGSRGADSIDVLLPEGDLAKLRSWFEGKLAGELKGGVELKSDRRLGAGFRIASRDGSAYYDFSSESAAKLLSAYLNPRLAEILKNAVKGN